MIGNNIKKSQLHLNQVTVGDGDIPSLLELSLEGMFFQVTVYKDVVIGISFDLEYETEKIYSIEYGNEKASFGFTSDFESVLAYIEIVGVEYQIIDDKNDCIEIEIKDSKVKLRFVNPDFDNLCKAYAFDFDMYNSICKRDL